tara:strand:- start:631 stop:1323 length:693 start_codon:yes stop_codon:yes gene_type:complete
MKNSVFRLCAAFLVSYIMTSCAASHSGNMLNSASLSTDNFYYVKTNVFASAECTYFLGLGGYEHEALVGEAKQNLYLKTRLSDNQTLANVTVSWKTQVTFLGFIVRRKCTISADVVEFKSEQSASQKNRTVVETPELTNKTEVAMNSNARLLKRVTELNNLGSRVKVIASTPKSVTDLDSDQQKIFKGLFKEYFRAFQSLPPSVKQKINSNDLVISAEELGNYYQAYLSL